MNLITKVLPQMMCQAHFTLVTIAFAFALGGVQGFTDRINDFSHMNLTVTAPKAITATRAAHTTYQLALAQLGKQLLKIRQRNILTLGDITQIDRPTG